MAERGRFVLDPSGEETRFIGTMLDITDSKMPRSFCNARRARRKRRTGRRSISRDALARAPNTMTPVLMTIASLRRDPNLTDDLRRDLEVLQRNVELEALLIDDLLDLTRIAHGKLELHSDAVDIHSMINHALHHFRGRSFRKKYSRDPALRRPRASLLGRSRAAPAGVLEPGEEFREVHAESGRLDLSTRNNEAHQIVIEITDNGIGIDPDLMPKIFDAFEQGGRIVTSRYGGLGLGLAISKRVVDLHHGTISARSAGPGQGATFVVTLNAMETSLLEGPVLFLKGTGRAIPTRADSPGRRSQRHRARSGPDFEKRRLRRESCR